jgi:hypothetical protein
MQALLQKRQLELAQLVMTKKISREQYIAELDSPARNCARLWPPRHLSGSRFADTLGSQPERVIKP